MQSNSYTLPNIQSIQLANEREDPNGFSLLFAALRTNIYSYNFSSQIKKLRRNKLQNSVLKPNHAIHKNKVAALLMM